MGYTPKRTLYKLDFSETEHAGLEVVTRSMPVGGLLKIAGLVEAADAENPDLGDLDELFRRFASVLVSWNVETDDGQPVPADFDGLAGQDFDFVLPVINAWILAMSRAPRPLPPASPPEETLGLAGQSMPLPNSLAPG
jgi:hypothetical protein